MDLTAEEERLREARRGVGWRRWGPYLSERQWGTVREDYSDDGDAWDYFPHDQARSRAYRWGEDGLAGICDDQQRLCFALALWNGRDPILKERLFGLTNAEGNHGEDVKEYYFYLDSHADALVHAVALQVPAGAPSPTTTWSRTNRPRGPRRARVRAARHRRLRRRPLLRRRTSSTPRPRRTTSCVRDHRRQPRPRAGAAPPAAHALVPQHLGLGDGADAEPDAAAAPRRRTAAVRRRAAPPSSARAGPARATATPTLLFTRERDEHRAALGQPNASRRYVKDGINDSVVDGGRTRSTRRGGHQGGRALTAGRRRRRGAVRCALRLSTDAPATRADPLRRLRRRSWPTRRREADEFYAAITPRDELDDDARGHAPGARRHALVASSTTTSTSTAGCDEHQAHPLRHRRAPRRAATSEWVHMLNARRHLDARQVGVPVVRRVGPRLPLRRARDGRPRLRQGASSS